MLQLLLELFTALARSWRDGTRTVRAWIVVAGGIAATALVVAVLAENRRIYPALGNQIVASLGVIAGAISLAVYGRQKSAERVEAPRSIRSIYGVPPLVASVRRAYLRWHAV